MKKQRFFMLGIITVLVAVLSLTFVSSTFAKYTTSGTATDSARVAKWGVTVAVNSAAFEKTYATDDTTSSLANSVEATVDVLAPGTKGTLVTANLEGKPEVAVRLSLDLTLELTGWTVNSAEYCPLEFKVNLGGVEETFKIDNSTINTVQDLIDAVTAYVEGSNAEYEANEDLSTAYDLTISWAWAFEGNDDAKDSKLGDAASAEISCKLDVKVEQID